MAGRIPPWPERSHVCFTARGEVVVGLWISVHDRQHRESVLQSLTVMTCARARSNRRIRSPLTSASVPRFAKLAVILAVTCSAQRYGHLTNARRAPIGDASCLMGELRIDRSLRPARRRRATSDPNRPATTESLLSKASRSSRRILDTGTRLMTGTLLLAPQQSQRNSSQTSIRWLFAFKRNLLLQTKRHIRRHRRRLPNTNGAMSRTSVWPSGCYYGLDRRTIGIRRSARGEV